MVLYNAIRLTTCSFGVLQLLMSAAATYLGRFLFIYWVQLFHEATRAGWV